MLGKVLFRLGIGVVTAVLSAVQGVLQGFDFSELGLYAGIAGVVAALIATGLGALLAKLQPPV